MAAESFAKMSFLPILGSRVKTASIYSEELAAPVFVIEFVPVLDGLDNLDFTTRMLIDSNGQVCRVEFYAVSFDRLLATPILSMEEAFGFLPVSGGIRTDFMVELTDARLVYRFKNSIVQPKWRFEGEQAGIPWVYEVPGAF